MLSLRHRFLLLLTLVLLSQAVHEWYPFSHYPMYSAFSDRASYLYLRKADGSPLAIRQAFGTDGSAVKKMFKSHVKEQQGDSAAAGLALLDQLAARHQGAEDPRTFDLVWVDVTTAHGELGERATVHGPLAGTLGPVQTPDHP